MEENKKTLKEKCRDYQKVFDYYVDTSKPILVHIDGRSFSKLIKNKFDKPFDHKFIDMMNKTAEYLCKQIQGAKMAYVQSDEISIYIKKDNPEGDVFFGGRLCKMISIISSLATGKFNQLMTAYHLSQGPKSIEDTIDIEEMPLYQFDCKVWNVDNENDVFAWFLFRNIDCVRNSKQQTAQTYFPHKKLMGLTADEQIEMLLQTYGRNWATFDDGEKYGRILYRTEYKYNVLSPDAQMEYEALKDKYKDSMFCGGSECVCIEEDDSDYIEVTRNIWKTIDGKDLTSPENKEWLKEMIHIA